MSKSALLLAAVMAFLAGATGCTRHKTVYLNSGSTVVVTPSPTPTPTATPTPTPTPSTSPSPSASPAPSPTPAPDADTDPAEVQAGERLFLETRFAQFFAANFNGDVNVPLTTGDTVMANLNAVAIVASGTIAGPFAGTAMNCRQCHLVDDVKGTPNITADGVRTYCDLARRSPVPSRLDRPDGVTMTPRNSPPLVNATFHRDGAVFFHFDGEFATVEDLVEGTFLGRNYGWLPDESATALSNFANVLRHDDGTGSLAAQYGSLSYRVVLAGNDPSIPKGLVLPSAYRINVDLSSDQQVLDAAAKLVHAYLDSLVFGQDSAGQFNGSPYDVFLKKNNLPQSPLPGESGVDYSQRLLGLINALTKPQLVDSTDGSFTLHPQSFQFGATELAGLKAFFTLGAPIVPGGGGQGPQASPPPTVNAGNCVACHTPPTFTDFKFHNIGSAQDEYDANFGLGTFATFLGGVPSWSERPDSALPTSSANPSGTSKYRSALNPADNTVADLGLWNVFANPHIPGPQPGLEATFGTPSDASLASTIALFKTASVRDPGQSAPYFHTGQKDTLEDVVQHYIDFSALAQSGSVPNADVQLSRIGITQDDLPNVVAFLRSLNEDYD